MPATLQKSAIQIFQIVQMIPNMATHHLSLFLAFCNSSYKRNIQLK